MVSERVQKVLALWEADDKAIDAGRLPRWCALIDDPRVTDVLPSFQMHKAFDAQRDDDIEHLTLKEAREAIRLRNEIVLKRRPSEQESRIRKSIWQSLEYIEEITSDVQLPLCKAELKKQSYRMCPITKPKSVYFIWLGHASWYAADAEADEIARIPKNYFNAEAFLKQWDLASWYSKSWLDANSDADKIARNNKAKLCWGQKRSWYIAQLEADKISISQEGLEDLKCRLIGDHVSDNVWKYLEIEDREKYNLAIGLPPRWSKFLDLDEKSVIFNPGPFKLPKNFDDEMDRQLAARWWQRKLDAKFFDGNNTNWHDYHLIKNNPSLKELRLKINGSLRDRNIVKIEAFDNHLRGLSNVYDFTEMIYKDYIVPLFKTVSLYHLRQLGLIILEPSGILYYNQVGGTLCYQEYAEGILTFPYDPDGKLKEFLAECMLDISSSNPITAKDADYIDALFENSCGAVPLKVNRDKLNQSYEAWLHVSIDYSEKYWNRMHTGFSRVEGILTWENSEKFWNRLNTGSSRVEGILTWDNSD